MTDPNGAAIYIYSYMILYGAPWIPSTTNPSHVSIKKNHQHHRQELDRTAVSQPAIFVASMVSPAEHSMEN